MLLVALPLAPCAHAQSSQDEIRSIVRGARLGTAYAQMVSLAATPDVSAASYDIDDPASDVTLDVIRLPYQARWLALAPDSDLYWRLAGGYLKMKQDLPMDLGPLGTGRIDSKWSAYSLSGGLLVRIRLGNGFTLEPAIDVGAARLENDASYDGAATLLRPLLDGLALNWRSDAWIATPSLALEWRLADLDRRIAVRAHVARSWISSFDESDPVLDFNETANAYSIRASYAAPTGLHAFERPLDWVAFAGYAGFFGANRDALGFTTVAEAGLGLEAPVTPGDAASNRVRLGASYLFGPDVSGWTVSAGVQY